MSGAVARARELMKASTGAWMSCQFENPANADAHVHATGLEILEQTGGDIGAFVAGVGTGGTISGVGRVLRERLGKAVRVVAVEPSASAVLSEMARRARYPGPRRGLVRPSSTARGRRGDRRQRRGRRAHGASPGARGGAAGGAELRRQRARRGEVARVVKGRFITVAADSGERTCSGRPTGRAPLTTVRSAGASASVVRPTGTPRRRPRSREPPCAQELRRSSRAEEHRRSSVRPSRHVERARVPGHGAFVRVQS